MAVVVPFRPRPIVKNCIGCGSHFVPKRSTHRRCPRCWAWHRACAFMAAAARLLREAG